MKTTPKEIKALVHQYYFRINVIPKNEQGIDIKKFSGDLLDWQEYNNQIRKQLISVLKDDHPLVRLLLDYEKTRNIAKLSKKLLDYKNNSSQKSKYFSMLEHYKAKKEEFVYPDHFFNEIIELSKVYPNFLYAGYILISEIANLINLLIEAEAIEEELILLDDSLITYIQSTTSEQMFAKFIQKELTGLIEALKEENTPLEYKLAGKLLEKDYNGIKDIIKAEIEKHDFTHLKTTLEKAISLQDHEAVKSMLTLFTNDLLFKDINDVIIDKSTNFLTTDKDFALTLKDLQYQVSHQFNTIKIMKNIVFTSACEAIIRPNLDIGLEFLQPEVWNTFNKEQQIELFKLIVGTTTESSRNAIINNLSENGFLNSIIVETFKLTDVSEEFLKLIANGLINFEDSIIRGLFKELVLAKVDAESNQERKDNVFIVNYLGFLKIIQFFSRNAKESHIKEVKDFLTKHYDTIDKFYQKQNTKQELKNLMNLFSLVLDIVKKDDKPLENSADNFKKPDGNDNSETIVIVKQDPNQKAIDFTPVDSNAIINENESSTSISLLQEANNENMLSSAKEDEQNETTPSLAAESELPPFLFSPELLVPLPPISGWLMPPLPFLGPITLLSDPNNQFSPAVTQIDYRNTETVIATIKIETQWFYYKKSHELVYSLTIDGNNYLIDIKEMNVASCARSELLLSQKFQSMHQILIWEGGQYLKLLARHNLEPIVEFTFKHSNNIGQILQKMAVYQDDLIEPHDQNDNTEESIEETKFSEQDTNKSSSSNENYANEMVNVINTKNNSLLEAFSSRDQHEFTVILPEKVSSSQNNNSTKINNPHEEFLSFKQEAEDSIEARNKVPYVYLDNSGKLESVTSKDGQYFITDFTNKLLNVNEIEA